MQQEQEEEQPRRELRKGDKLGRQGGSGIMTRKRRLPRCDFFASFRHPPSGPQVVEVVVVEVVVVVVLLVVVVVVQ